MHRLLFLLPLLPCCPPADAAVWSVRADGTGDAPTVAAALAGAGPGDEIVLEPGTYFESGLILVDQVTLRGATGDPADAVLDGQGLGRIFTGAGLESGTRIEGLTIRGGRVSAPCADPGAGTYCLGAGLLLVDSTVEISRCRFVENEADDNGGGVSSVLSAPTFLDCVFERNTARHGAAITFVSSQRHGQSPRLERCRLEANTATADAGGLYAYASTPEIVECTFRANVAGEQGSAIAWHGFAPAVIERTLIADGAGDGPILLGIGAVPPQLACCDLWGNEGGDWVGFLSVQREAHDNLWADPRFCAEEGDGIDATSPCAAAGCGGVGSGDVACSATGSPERIRAESWGRVKSRFRR